MKTFRGRFDANTMGEKLPLPEGLLTTVGEVKGMAKVRRSNMFMMWDCYVVETINEQGRKVFSFSHGWPQVVEGNKIKHGDLLYFEFHGNSLFTLTVVGSDNISIELEDLICDVDRAHWATIGDMHLRITPAENSMAAACYMVNSDKENFMVSCIENTVSEGYLTIPKTFAKKNLIYENVGDVTTVVLELRGYKATVGMKYLKDDAGELQGCILNSSFQSFAKYHGLDKGGVVVFELESPFDPVVLKMSLFNK